MPTGDAARRRPPFVRRSDACAARRRRTRLGAMPLPFTPSDPLTLGVELELQIIDAESRDLAPGAPQLFERLGGPRPNIKPEIFQAMLEVSTGVCRDVTEVRRHLDAVLADVRQAADALGIRLAS